MPAHQRNRDPSKESRRQAAERLIKAGDNLRAQDRAGKTRQADRDEVADATKSYDDATRRERGR